MGCDAESGLTADDVVELLGMRLSWHNDSIYVLLERTHNGL
jgi:hypothetical protein